MKNVFNLMTVLVMSALTLKAQAMMGPSAGGGGVPSPPHSVSVVFHQAAQGVDENLKKAVLKLAASYVAKGQVLAMGELAATEEDDRASICVQFKDVADLWNAEVKFWELVKGAQKVEVVEKAFCFTETAPKMPQFPGDGPTDPSMPQF